MNDRLQPLLRPGDTCWRIAAAHRVAVLLDNAQYFAAAASALTHARRSILLLGWQFDPRTELVPGAATMERSSIGKLLNALAREREDLDIRILIWDAPLPIVLARPGGAPPEHWAHRRIRTHQGDHHPWGACQHQKILVIDDSIAFCSCGDFTTNRWDTSEHRAHDPRRRLPSGRNYPARHNVAMLVDGDAAAALGELARERLRAAGEDPGESRGRSGDPWPRQVLPHFSDVPIAIARTEPSRGRSRGVAEIRRQYLALIAAADRLLYLENQYFASPLIASTLQGRLAEPNGPEIIYIGAHHSSSYFDRLTMDAERKALLRELEKRDPHGRFHAYAPYTDAGTPMIVHSKLTIVDDRVLRIGSANLNNRSLGFDTECDLTLDAELLSPARRGPVCASITRIRQQLVGHFHDANQRTVADVERQMGSVQGAIEALGKGRKRLVPLRGAAALDPLRALIARYHLGDPESTADSWRPWRRRRTPVVALASRGLLLAAGLALAFGGLLFARRTHRRRRDHCA